jgi:hypothetical protein
MNAGSPLRRRGGRGATTQSTAGQPAFAWRISATSEGDEDAPSGASHARRSDVSHARPLACHLGVSDLELERKGCHMSVHMVQAKIRRESVTDVQAAAKRMFAAIDAAQPEGIRYASSLLPDGETFVALLQIDDGVENPLPGFPEFREFLEGVEASRAEPANVQPLTVIGSYRMF